MKNVILVLGAGAIGYLLGRRGQALIQNALSTIVDLAESGKNVPCEVPCDSSLEKE